MLARSNLLEFPLKTVLWVTVILAALGLLAACGPEEVAVPVPDGEPYALIYNGPVADADGAEAVAALAQELDFPVVFISDIADLPELLDGAAVFVIGGTEDDLDPLIDAFTPEVMAALDTYLLDGGRYWGICGGGYLASTGWEEEDGFVDMLDLIPAKSSEFDENDEPQILQIDWLEETYPMYFQFGPAFELTESTEDINVFATYDDGSIAGLMASYGDGKVAVCGPHPEAEASWGDEVDDGEAWEPVTALGVALLQELLSDNPVSP